MERYILMKQLRAFRGKENPLAPFEVMKEGTTLGQAQYEAYRRNHATPGIVFAKYSVCLSEIDITDHCPKPTLEVLFQLGTLPPPVDIDVVDGEGTFKKECSLKTTTYGDHKILMSFGGPCEYYLEDMLAHRDKLKKMDALCIDSMGRNHRGTTVWVATAELERVIDLWKLREWDWTTATAFREIEEVEHE